MHCTQVRSSKRKVTKPTDEQLKEALDHAEEKHHAILFLYKSDKKRYGKLIEEMENDVSQKKDPFPKTVVQHVSCPHRMEKQIQQ